MVGLTNHGLGFYLAQNAKPVKKYNSINVMGLVSVKTGELTESQLEHDLEVMFTWKWTSKSKEINKGCF